ncbi:two component transcriptional regulator, LytTR family [Humidesulfovibrio mexicanus]|uniref:Two component transcriptional regulator, LytTR family n=1 Tax=Humidesulfovibrio mexicanus TaxID=147047 RepID=A0A238Y8U8_9BACT|nr:response regulator [Humidesulfovibrio mexicanus]SNR67362.1 two component transcriptional regulator, LytTR family [Humidesulfovibrio mexicanus]
MTAPHLRALIVDDEAPARDELLYLLEAHPDVEAAQAAGAREAMSALAHGGFDLVFQDIQMPGEDGFAVLAAAQELERPPLFVFVTAFDQHAIRAFEENAADYLLKPVAPDRLAKSLGRVRRALAEPAPQDLSLAIERLLSSAGRDAARPLGRIAVEQGGRIALIPTSSILFIEADEKRLVAVTACERLTCHGLPTLAKAAERLTGQAFFQANRAQLVNLEHIVEFTPWFGGKYCVVMADPARTEVTVSRNRVRAFKQRLGI